MAEADATGRDRVLVAFHAVCERPTAEDVAAWIRRHPTYARDFRFHAEAVLATIDHPDAASEPSPALLERTGQQTLETIARVRAEARSRRKTRARPSRQPPRDP